MPVITLPVPPPMRDKFVGKEGDRNTDKNSGIGYPWVRWFLSIFTTLSEQVASINGSTIVDSTQGNLSTLAGTFTPANSGQLVYVTDYNHVLRWNGTGFEWGPGENGSGYITPFLNDPSPVTGWQLCNGTATTKLNSDGTTSPVVVPNYATASYLKLGSAAPVAGPTAPSGVTGATSAGTPAGTNSAPVFTGTPANTGNNSANVAVQAGAGTVVAADPHDHPYTPAGTVSAPVFTGAALATHTHTPGTIELQRTQLKAYFRR